MKMFFATLAIALLLISSVSSLNAQEVEQETEEESTTQQMPMMQGGMMPMMQQGMMGQTPMMPGSMMGGQGGMMCPMCGQMMKGGMMGGMMQGGMMGQMPMMQGMMGQGMMRGGMMGVYMPNAPKLLALTDELKLEDEQIKSLKALSLNSQKGAIRKSADLSIARLELNALLEQEKIDLEQVQQKVKEVANLGAELKIAQIEASIQAKDVLTEEQLALLKEITKKRAMAVQKPAMQKSEKPMREEREREMHRR